MSEITNFNTNPTYLASNLFYSQRPRIGAVTYLNVNILPDFLLYLKKKLTAQELIGLSEYQLQTYIMELSIKQKVTQSFDSFVQKILTHIRKSKQFWIHGKIVSKQDNQEKQKQQKKHQIQAMAQYQIDIQCISKKIPSYPEKIFNDVKKRRIQQTVEILNEQNYFDRNKQVLKITLNNYSMMPGYVLKNFYQKYDKIKLPSYKNLKTQHKNKINKLEQIAQFILMSLKPKIIKKQYIKTRSLQRNRKVPSYLQNKPIILQQPINQDPEQEQKQQNDQNDIILENNIKQKQQQDQPYQFYNQFDQTIRKKQFYQSKMFNKTKDINQSHNILQILNCALYLLSNKQQDWFQQTWKQLQQQRILRQKKRKQQEEEQESSDQNQEKQQKNQNQKIKQEKEQKQDHKQSLNKQLSGVQSINNSNSDQFIQIGIKKPIFCDIWKNPHFKIDKLFSNFQMKIFSMRQIYFLTKQILNSKKLKDYSFYRKIQIQTQNKSKNMTDALVNPDLDLDQIYNEFKQMIQHPQNMKLSSFKTQGVKIPWDQSDYLIFLKGLLQYFFVPTNNKKIAVYMSKGTKNIQANHVKYVKNLYLKNMHTRIDRGQSGGGKKSRMLGKLQFLEKDIQFFSMKWFQKLKKTKKKRNKRKNQSGDAAQELDSAY